MKIDLDYGGLRFIWDTDQHLVRVHKPMKEIDRFEVSPGLKTYQEFRQNAKQYVEYFCLEDRVR